MDSLAHHFESLVSEWNASLHWANMPLFDDVAAKMLNPAAQEANQLVESAKSLAATECVRAETLKLVGKDADHQYSIINSQVTPFQQ